jgi:toxin YoeB
MVHFTREAWEQYLYWQTTDRNIVKPINQLIKDCTRDPFVGIGKPEPLKGDLAGVWSRRIDDMHRLVYKYENDEIYVISCRFH